MTESFAQLFEEFLNETEFQQGSIVKGTVVLSRTVSFLLTLVLSLNLLSLLNSSRTLLANLKLKLALK
jgi:hypothetical protein